MNKILSKLFGGVGTNIAEKISNIIDKHTFSKIEKARFEKEMTEIWINAEADIQKNVTERWRTDMKSDSWLSKNVRPLVLIFLVVSTVLMVFIDAGTLSFEVKDNWVDLLQLVLITVIGAYFGGRSFEKIKK
jgi:cation transport ATPase|tara:strand:+ start:51 stop:446 length:396 start_codon:yes stop_codon:yes gene_type:complete